MAALAGALTVAAVVFGVGVSNAHPKLSDVGAWLGSLKKGMVVHANGMSGRVDGQVPVRDGKGHPLRVVQEGSHVLIIDETTGVVSRIDASTLSVVQAREMAIGIQLVVSGGAAYAVDPQRGTVQQIDPLSLASIGAPAQLTAPLGQSSVDSLSVLWVTEPATGNVVPVRGGVAAHPVKVGDPGNALTLTIAAGQAVVTNSAKAQAMLVGTSGTKLQIGLPPSVSQSGQAGVLAPILTEVPLVPLLSKQTGDLVLLDIQTGAISTTSVPGSAAELGAPQVLGKRVYIPDPERGRLIVYDSAAKAFVGDIAVTGKKGPLEAFLKGGLLWVNSQETERALVIDPEGVPHPVDKYEPDVPGPTRTPKPDPNPQQPADPKPGKPNPEPGKPEPPQPPNPDPPQPEPPRQPEPEKPPTAPGNVVAESGPGRMTITFSPSAEGKPTGYVLIGADAPEVGPDGPFRFEVNSNDCNREFRFKVAATWAGGQQVESDETAAVRPCVAPGAPRNFTAAKKNHGANLSWAAPANSEGAPVTYILEGPGGGEVQGTSRDVGGLANNQTHSWTLRAKNAAGESQERASESVNLAYPRHVYRNANNNQTNSLIQCSPQGGCKVGQIDEGVYMDITVICQTRGAAVHEEESGETSNVWDRIQWNGGEAYISDTLMATPRGGFPAGPLFEC